MDLFLRSGVLTIVAILSGFQGAASPDQTMPRTIRYDRALSISARLTVSDKRVTVLRSIPEDVAQRPVPETFEEETRRISAYDSIGLITISDVQGQLVEGGTWIRTRARGQIDQRLKSGSQLPQTGALEFWQDGGVTQIGSVSVSAEPYTALVPHHQYLMFLRTDIGRGTTYAALAYRVEPNGALREVRRSDGMSWSPDSTLVGRRVSEVAAAMKR